MSVTVNETSVAGRAAAPLRNPRPFKWQRLLARIVLYALCALFVLPIYSMVTSGLKTPAELGSFPPTLFPHTLAWGNFDAATSFIPFWKYFGNTVDVALFSTLGAVVSSFVVAYGFARFNFPGRDFFFYSVLGSIFLAGFPVLTLIPLFDMFTRLGWLNTFLPLIVPSWFGNAFYIYLLRQFLLRLPPELMEAARIDGAGELRVLWSIVLPLSIPAVAVVAVFALFNSWNDFLGPLVYLQDESKYTLDNGISLYNRTHDAQTHLMNMASTLVVLPEIVLFLIFQRAFLSGIAAGAVK
jgi:multiple sugar transport system permease protein